MSFMIEKLTAKEPKWSCAAIYVRDGQPTLISPEHGKLRYLREESLIEIEMHGVDDPLQPPTPPHKGQDGNLVAGVPGGKADQFVYFHEDDITRVDFFTSIPASKLVKM